MSKKYRIYCKDEPHGEDRWQYIWSNTFPSLECPVNASHEVNPDSVSDIAIERAISTTSPIINSIYTIQYSRIAVFSFNSNPFADKLRRIRLLYYTLSPDVSFNVKVIDLTNSTTLSEDTCTESSLSPSYFKSSVVLTPPTEDAILEVHVKKNSGTGNIIISTINLIIESSNY